MRTWLTGIMLMVMPMMALAEVKVYGEIKTGYESVSSHDRGTIGTASNNGIADYGSKVGIRGSENLDNGFKAIWQAESGLSSDKQNRSYQTGRTDGDSYVGLSR